MERTEREKKLIPRYHLLDSKDECSKCKAKVSVLYLVDKKFVCEECKIQITGNKHKVDLKWENRRSTSKESVGQLKLTNKTATELVNSFGDKIIKNGEKYFLYMNGKEIAKSKRISKLRKVAKQKRKVKDRLIWEKK